MFKYNLAAVLNTQRPDKKGLYPLRLRTTIKGKVKYYPTGIMLQKKYWDQSKETIIDHPQKALLNAALTSKVAEVEKSILEYAITGEEVANKKKNNAITFNEYATKKIEEWTGLHSDDTISHKWSYLSRVNDCLPAVRLKAIDKAMLTRVENYCREQGNSGNTIVSYTKFIKTIINAAVEDGILPASPIKGFVGVKYINPMRDTLTPDEITKIEEFANNQRHSPKLLNTANWFLFSCYCGLRYGDLAGFVDFKNDKVLIQTEKTKEVVSIYATKKIIEAKNRITKEIYTNQKSNEYLKAISAIVGIDKKITFHNARHTFAVQFLERGGRLEILSKILGHSSIKTTQIYAKISTKLADAEMQKVWD